MITILRTVRDDTRYSRVNKRVTKSQNGRYNNSIKTEKGTTTMSLLIKRELTSKQIRQRNQEQIFFFLRTMGALPISELSFLTHLSISTVKTVIHDLEHLGLVQAREQGESTGGRKPTLYSIQIDQEIVAGISIGYRRVKCGIFRIDGSLIGQYELEPDRIECTVIAETIRNSIKSLIDSHKLENIKLAGMGISQPGSVDFEGKTIISTMQKSLEGDCLWKLLKETFEVPVYLMEDINAHIAAEFELGEAKEWDHWVFLLLGSSSTKWGIGAEVVSNGSWIRGESGLAGEAGHMIISTGGRRCTCGHRGCWEAESDPFRIFGAFFKKKNMNISEIRELFPAIRDELLLENEEIRPFYSEFLGLLADGIVNFVHLFNPEKIYIGGEVVSLGESFFADLKKEVGVRCLPPYWKNSLIEMTHITSDSDMFGAASWVLGQLIYIKGTNGI